MSMTARHENRKDRQQCHECRERRARFQYHGRVSADRDHTLCFACYRAERERQRAERLSITQSPMLRAFELPVALTDRAVAHRRRMLEHLRRSAAGG